MNRWNAGMISVFLLLMLWPQAASAHTGLSSSNPENNETVAETLQVIDLTFNTAIEPASRFEVIDASGTVYPVADMKVNRSRMSGTMEEPLPNGVYTVNWKIIGQDGHSVKGAYTFKVEIPPPETPSQAPEETGASASPTSSSSLAESTESEAPGTSSPIASAQPPQPQEEPVASEGPSLTASAAVSWIFLGLAAVVLAAFIVLAIFRKKPR